MWPDGWTAATAGLSDAVPDGFSAGEGQGGVSVANARRGDRQEAERRNGETDDNEVPCSFGSKQPYRTLIDDHPFIDWCGTTNATKLTADLSDLVKRHNKAVTLPRLETAQRVLDMLLGQSDDAAEERHGSSRWAMLQPSFQARIMKHDYALERYSLHEVRFFRRLHESFTDSPGDGAPVA